MNGSANFTVSNTIREASGSINGTITYRGSCPLVKAELRFSYLKGEDMVTGEEVNGVDTHFALGPLAAHDPYQNTYLGEDTFTPDAIVFVISHERCA